MEEGERGRGNDIKDNLSDVTIAEGKHLEPLILQFAPLFFLSHLFSVFHLLTGHSNAQTLTISLTPIQNTILTPTQTF